MPQTTELRGIPLGRLTIGLWRSIDAVPAFLWFGVPLCIQGLDALTPAGPHAVAHRPAHPTACASAQILSIALGAILRSGGRPLFLSHP